MSSPIIFEKGTRDFSTLGLGLLSDAIQATTTEELNGQFIFEMDYPVSGNNADLIKENRIIVVNSGHILKRQGFIIRQIVRKIDLTMTVYAEHVSYATLDVALAPVGTISGDAKTALENWKRMLVPAVDFTVDSDILTTNSTLIGAPEFETARQGLGGHAGSILDVWGGEYQFDNWHIRLLKQRGKSANAIIAYGRNLISFEQDTNIADTYTSVYPYYQENSGDEGNKTHFLPERTVDSEFVGKYPNPKVLMLDLSNKFKDVADYSETKLRNYTLSYIQSNNIGVPKVNMKISTVDLSRATGGFSEDIDLGDTVNVYFEKLGITTSAKVIKAVWNVLSDDYDKFEIGARRSSLTESISELATTADENANKALNQALVAQQSADGKTTIYYLDTSDPWPTNPKENDTAFVKDGENSIMYRYMFNNDTGVFSWVKILDSMSADQIKQRVSDAVESGKAYSDQLVADNVAQVNTVLDDVQAKQTDLTAQQAELDTKAQGYANKALVDAKADTLATATQTAKDAQDALDSAKTALTTSLNKEVTDRTNAVSALDTKVQGYADTAKTDAINAATTADGVINKKIDDTASSITSTISQNKADADGKITTAQSTAQQALDGLSTKVSQTAYDTKTGQLQTDLNTTTTTANQAKTDIVAIKKTNTDQDARMLTIESDANGTKTTVSNLQTDLGKANGSITTLQQRADGFDATVATLGGVNQVINSEFTPDFSGWLKDLDFTNNRDMSDVTGLSLDQYTYKQSNIIKVDTSKYNFNPIISMPVKITDQVGQISFSAYISTVTGYTGRVSARIKFYDANRVYISTSSGPTVTSNTGMTYVSETVNPPVGATYVAFAIGFDAKDGFVRMSKPMMSFSSKVMDYVQGNYNNNASVAKAQLTADNASLALSNYQTDADGRISRAQADIIVNANAITQKVSQSDYNAKTGDLTTKVNTAQSTADSATSTIGSYKTANDARVASAESKITANATAITSKVSQSDYNTKTGQIDGQISTINQTAGQISQSVSNVKAQVDGLSVGGTNLFVLATASKGWLDLSYNVTASGDASLASDFIPVTANTTYVAQQWYIMSHPNGGGYLRYAFYDSTKTPINRVPAPANNSATYSKWVITTPANTAFIRMSFDYTANNGSKVKFEQGNLPTDWSPAPEDVDNKISTVSQTVDGISSIVSDPTTGLTKRVQTAEGTLSQVTGVDIPALQKVTYWQAPNSYDLNTYLTQGSTFFMDTTARANAPTTSTKWMYLVVERIPNSDRVTQTAWYSTQTDAKITYRRQYAGTWGAWYANDNDSVATIAQTNGAIQTEISNRQTGDTNTLTQAKDFTTSSITSSESGMRSQITQTSDAIIAQIGNTNLVFNSEFDPDNDGWYKVPAVGQPVSAPIKTPITTAYSDWEETHGSRGVLFDNTNGTIWTSKPVRVAQAGVYSMSMLAGRPSASDTTVTTDFRLGLWDADKKYIGTIGSSNPMDGTTYLPLTLYKTENLTIPDGTQYISFVLVRNASADVIYQPMLNYGAKSVKYTPTYGTNSSSTILSLLKDNWSIGIADNAGAITSGIVGNASNMSLISNNVTINSPQTQIKGTAWIKSAMIGNGQIGNAQIGDASISSAKIMNLDVNKITGNVSNWVLSQWTSATGSKVTIDGSGLYFSPGTSRMTVDGFEAWRMDGGSYKAMGLLGSYAWETNANINGVGLIAKFSSTPHANSGDPYRNEAWGGDTIAIGALEPEKGNGYDYVTPYMIFPANGTIGEMYQPGNNNDTLILSRWLSIYTGLNMRGHAISNSSGYSLKENFSPVSGTDALDIFDNTEIMTYDYKPDADDMDEQTLSTMRNKVGFVINDNGESPFKTDPRLVRYGNTRDDSVTVGYLMSAVKELHAQVKELKTQLGK